ncbi:hypothetical protein PHYBLDRAFT_171139 [Phycomyces blakesleeanus NRRL 1555(-)]|uniref:Uncharacterized protein n=1 Tax=Phycomyces blakesleeanus (strain ATCC 8743b / DSM 1359 / FGSC 10004 / NBRC 33097 / NRRL 1555) TaxID=763407 RepID=A0A163A4S3_PHYB8|nr:hypothetical protein PHYBLDRAFT_171139 [Phycomyces blakesleeanus NRRL 1555(-)]OAD71081.1 hypothetical protein PHYBLDRAFT_171139 [Phycomyces blakesleeanus NRRL 1555(-)]|eukprot:XP_018289121.1 hypothetical protein PHYBLDRAFT_171139 [Phycomyces blakesleeanus NRRL 1555(-)]
MSTYKITQILEHPAYLEESNALIRHKVSLLENRCESLTKDSKTEQVLSTRDNASNAILLLSTTDDCDIKCLSYKWNPDGWNQLCSTNNIAIPSWGCLADDQKAIMSSSLKKNAALKNISPHRFQKSLEHCSYSLTSGELPNIIEDLIDNNLIKILF